MRAFLPDRPADDAGTVLFDVPGLSVAFASPEHLLAMKMAAYRPGQDQDDLVLLFGLLDITTAEDAAEISIGVYGDNTVGLPGRDELVLSAQAVLDRMSARSHPRRGRRSDRDDPGGRP